MSNSSFSSLLSVYDWLGNFANLENFWSLLETAFGSSYDFATAASFRSQWQSQNFSQFPQIEIVSNNVLGSANGAYSFSTNTIYLSEQFLASASQQSLVNLILEEFGHFVDAQINSVDSAGDEGAIFAALVAGESLDALILQALKTEDDHGFITVNGEVIQVEQQDYTGTNGNETLVGTSGNDTFNPLRGRDTVNGGDGNDLLIIDYSTSNHNGLPPAVGIQTLSFYDLGNGLGQYEGVYQVTLDPISMSYDSVSFTNIERFQITGTVVNDAITTGGGNDLLAGAVSNSLNPGIGEIDRLEGGAGADTYILGNFITSFYDDDDPMSMGTTDYARIVGFDADEDRIQLSGPTTNYFLGNSPIPGITGTGIILAKPGAEPDELIAIIEGVTGLDLNSNAFFVAPNEPGTLSFSQATFSTSENNNASITVIRTGGSLGVVTATITLSNGTASASDYNNSPIIVNFADGQTSQTISVPIINDALHEINETINLSLVSATRGNQATAVLTIDDSSDRPTISFTSSSQTVVEGLTSPQNLSYTVSLSNPSTRTITVQYATANGTALAGSDYTTSIGTLTFNPTETTKTITVPILDNSVNELNETFTLTLSNPTNATLGTVPTTTTTITDTLGSSVTTILPPNVENLTLYNSPFSGGFVNTDGTGNGSNNIITGTTVDNVLNGEGGNDTLNGGAGIDTLNGGAGNDILNGQDGNDTLNGGTENDTLNGGAGLDNLTGGTGADTFIFQFGQSYVDRITDFAIGTDKIDLLTSTGLATPAPTSFSRATNSAAADLTTVVNNVFTDANGAIAGNQALAINSAALVQVTTAGIAGTYLVINNGTAGFQNSILGGNNDSIVNITGFTGTVPALGTISVNSFFV
ncbi:Calx-beta domain-containing protein [Microcystis sp. BLCC-F210]|uniref:Calx-beta domain-containing protein n=1 Tax=Microcystis sp. BLCC-F210 TaxID=3342751 RepID=UPI0035C940C9